MLQTLTGKRFRSLVQDMEEDEEYGEVIHPVGSEFIVAESMNDHWIAAWQGTAVDKSGNKVPARGMWTLWTPEEIATEAVEVK